MHPKCKTLCTILKMGDIQTRNGCLAIFTELNNVKN